MKIRATMFEMFYSMVLFIHYNNIYNYIYDKTHSIRELLWIMCSIVYLLIRSKVIINEIVIMWYDNSSWKYVLLLLMSIDVNKISNVYMFLQELVAFMFMWFVLSYIYILISVLWKCFASKIPVLYSLSTLSVAHHVLQLFTTTLDNALFSF